MLPKRPLTQGEQLREPTLTPAERVASVRPFWASLTREQRAKLLRVQVTELRKHARAASRTRQQPGSHCTL